MRASLLSVLLDASYAPDRIDILLDEKRIDDAVATVDRKDGHFHSPHDDTLMRLADAACAHHPDWANPSPMYRPVARMRRSSVSGTRNAASQRLRSEADMPPRRTATFLTKGVKRRWR